jgi:hypothetical protein
MRLKSGKADIHSGAEQRDHCGSVRATTKLTLDPGQKIRRLP